MFAQPAALLRLAGAVLVEARDEWQVSDLRYLSEGSMALLGTRAAGSKEVATPKPCSRHSQHQSTDHHTVKITYTTRRDATVGHGAIPAVHGMSKVLAQRMEMAAAPRESEPATGEELAEKVALASHRPGPSKWGNST